MGFSSQVASLKPCFKLPISSLEWNFLHEFIYVVDFSPTTSINLHFRKTLTLGLVHCATLSLSLNNEITKQRWIVYRDVTRTRLVLMEYQ